MWPLTKILSVLHTGNRWCIPITYKQKAEMSLLDRGGGESLSHPVGKRVNKSFQYIRLNVYINLKENPVLENPVLKCGGGEVAKHNRDLL